MEPVLTGGMDNPVSVTFTPEGERILTGTFFVHPGGGQRDGLIHAIYGGVYGKDHDVLDGHKRTGDLMPIMTHHGPSASCFVLRYESGAWGREYQDNLFACLFNLHKVMRHVLVPAGATYQTHDEDFLMSDSTDFHPTDLVEDADGSLLVVDTGGWYKLCCPTSQLWKPDILGAIYRIRRTGAPRLNDPRGTNIQWPALDPAALTALLGDARPFVCRRALDQLAQKGASAVLALRRTVESNSSVQARRNAVWALTRIEGESARQAVRLALTDADASVRHSAVHSISIWRDAPAVPALIRILAEPAPALQRVAAEALGRMGDRAAVGPLLAAASTEHDRVLEHSLTYALIELDFPDAVRESLSKNQPSPSTRRAGLIALDQMDNGGLTVNEVTPFLGSSAPVLKQAAFWIAGHHPDWASALAGFFRERLASGELSSADRVELQDKLAELASASATQKVLADVLEGSSFPASSRLVALNAMARAHVKQPPVSWEEPLARAVANPDPAEVAAAVGTARALAFPSGAGAELASALHGVAANASQPLEIRLSALAAIPGGLKEVDAETFDLLRSSLDGAHRRHQDHWSPGSSQAVGGVR
jgi:hypothetical protein